jgi:hypothetical protein
MLTLKFEKNYSFQVAMLICKPSWAEDSPLYYFRFNNKLNGDK